MLSESAHQVRLRNGLLATVWCSAIEDSPWTLTGLDAESCFHVWRHDGRWRARVFCFEVVMTPKV